MEPSNGLRLSGNPRSQYDSHPTGTRARLTAKRVLDGGEETLPAMDMQCHFPSLRPRGVLTGGQCDDGGITSEWQLRAGVRCNCNNKHPSRRGRDPLSPGDHPNVHLMV